MKKGTISTGIVMWNLMNILQELIIFGEMHISIVLNHWLDFCLLSLDYGICMVLMDFDGLRWIILTLNWQ